MCILVDSFIHNFTKLSLLFKPTVKCSVVITPEINIFVSKIRYNYQVFLLH